MKKALSKKVLKDLEISRILEDRTSMVIVKSARAGVLNTIRRRVTLKEIRGILKQWHDGGDSSVYVVLIIEGSNCSDIVIKK